MAPDLQPPEFQPGDRTAIDYGTALTEPPMYRVILHNDHYTAMDFVVEVLMQVFHKPAAEATKIMMDVHKQGHGVCGVYTYDLAVTKVRKVHDMARSRGFPLKCTFEQD